MNSYISNSKLWLSLGATLLMVATYSFLISGQQAFITNYQNQWVKNYSTVERFLYAETHPDTVIVGSSMAARLFSSELNRSAYNLSLASTGPLTGLAIIEQSGIRPSVILVESNILEKERDTEILSRLFTPILWQAKAQVQALQYTYQPINFLVSWLYTLKNGTASDRQKKVNSEVFEKEVARRTRKSEYTKDLEDTPVFSELAATIQRLKTAGTKVVLFDAPMDPRVATTTRYTTRQLLVKKLLPEIPWLRLSTEQHAQYQTSDGAHLTPASAREFSRHLGQMLERL